MNKTSQLRAWAFYLGVGVPLATSCAKEANTLDGGNDGDGGKSSAGSANKAGAGAGNKAGQSNSFGGTGGMPSGGKSTGGTATGDAGDGAAVGGEATGVGGTGGTGGSNTVPPDVLERASAIVYYETSHTTAMDGTIQMKLYIVNQSADPLPMKNVKIRYWFTAEVTPTLHQYHTGEDVRPPSAAFVDAGDETHVLMTFGGGTIAKGADKSRSEVQLQIDNNAGKFDQSDDFSWEPTSITSTPNGKITLYLDDTLIWGCEPSGQCFGEGGAGGAGGAGAGGMGSAGEPSLPEAGGAGGAGGAP
jgi:hypothetical protein